MYSNIKWRILLLSIFIALLLGFLPFCHYLMFLYTHDPIISQMNKEMILGDNINESLNYSTPTVVLKGAAEETEKNESELNSRRNVTLINGRQAQRIKLADSLRVDKIHIVIRTSAKFHRSRLELMLLTWLQSAFPSNVSGWNVVYT